MLGLSITLTGEKAKPFSNFFVSFSEIMFTLTDIVMRFAPYGVFGLIAWVVGYYGLEVILPLIKVVALVYLACIFHVIFMYAGALTLLGRLNPIIFFKKIMDAQLVAFSTTSSSGTLPVTLKCVQKKMGVSQGVSSFVLPLGATINMDGTALYQGVTALFIAQVYGVSLDFSDYGVIILTSTLASIGTAGVPGAGLIMLSLVLTSVGLPMEGVAIIAGIDRILDMARTTVNVTGDATVALLVGQSEKELNIKTYNA